MPNNQQQSDMHFPHFNRIALITPKQENNDAEDAYWEGNSAVHRRVQR